MVLGHHCGDSALTLLLAATREVGTIFEPLFFNIHISSGTAFSPASLLNLCLIPSLRSGNALAQATI